MSLSSIIVHSFFLVIVQKKVVLYIEFLNMVQKTNIYRHTFTIYQIPKLSVLWKLINDNKYSAINFRTTFFDISEKFGQTFLPFFLIWGISDKHFGRKLNFIEVSKTRKSTHVSTKNRRNERKLFSFSLK